MIYGNERDSERPRLTTFLSGGGSPPGGRRRPAASEISRASVGPASVGNYANKVGLQKI